MESRKTTEASTLEIKHARSGYTSSWTARKFEKRIQGIQKLRNKVKREMDKKPDFLNFDNVKVYTPELMGEELVRTKLKKFERQHPQINKKNQARRKNRGQTNESWKFAKTTKLPNFKLLKTAFERVQRRREKSRVQRSRIESNAITRLRKCSYLMESNRGKRYDPMPDTTLLVSVSIFASCNSGLYGKRLREILFETDSTLIDLRDKIECLDDENDVKGYGFLIDNTMYVDEYDTDDPDQLHLPQQVREWVFQRKRHEELHLHPYEIKSIRGVKLKDLPIRLGAHYLYFHQGGCFHTIIFSEMRQIHPTQDVKNRHAYPLVTFEMVHRIQLCGVCGKRPADLVTYDDLLTPTSPFFFCRECFVGFHFDTDNRLIYKNFQVYHYKYD